MTAYLSAREAADYCGVSEKTVRNWIAAGRLQAEKSAGSFCIDQERLKPFRRKSAPVVAGADRQPEPSGAEVRGTSAEPFPPEEVLRLLRESRSEDLALIERQQQTIMKLAGRVGYYQAEMEQLRAQFALAAPKEEPPEPVEEKGWLSSSAAAAASAPAVNVSSRAWWRRWLGR